MRRSTIFSKQTGIGLRFPHHTFVAENRPEAGWFEVHTENYLGGGTPLRYLNAVRRNYPISLHGVGLSPGSADGMDAAHLARVKDLAGRIDPVLVSEHLSFSSVDGIYLADLLPLPMTEEALDVVCRNIDAMQSALNRKILIENPSSYLRYVHSVIPEWEFLAEVSRRTGCGLLCDVNNIFVSCANHGWDADEYLKGLPHDAVGEIHLAGHAVKNIGGHILRIDDHGAPVCDEVWSLYAAALRLFGNVPALIEWDTNIPAFEVLQAEAAKAQAMAQGVTMEASRDDAA